MAKIGFPFDIVIAVYCSDCQCGMVPIPNFDPPVSGKKAIRYFLQCPTCKHKIQVEKEEK